MITSVAPVQPTTSVQPGSTPESAVSASSTATESTTGNTC